MSMHPPGVPNVLERQKCSGRSEALREEPAPPAAGSEAELVNRGLSANFGGKVLIRIAGLHA